MKTNQLPPLPTPKFTETIRGVPCITVAEHEHLMRAYAMQASAQATQGVRDAKRYEWLRQHQLLAKINFMPTPSGEDLDAAIDAAMLAAKEGTNGEIN